MKRRQGGIARPRRRPSAWPSPARVRLGNAAGRRAEIAILRPGRMLRAHFQAFLRLRRSPGSMPPCAKPPAFPDGGEAGAKIRRPKRGFAALRPEDAARDCLKGAGRRRPQWDFTRPPPDGHGRAPARRGSSRFALCPGGGVSESRGARESCPSRSASPARGRVPRAQRWNSPNSRHASSAQGACEFLLKFSRNASPSRFAHAGCVRPRYCPMCLMLHASSTRGACTCGCPYKRVDGGATLRPRGGAFDEMAGDRRTALRFVRARGVRAGCQV